MLVPSGLLAKSNHTILGHSCVPSLPKSPRPPLAECLEVFMREVTSKHDLRQTQSRPAHLLLDVHEGHEGGCGAVRGALPRFFPTQRRLTPAARQAAPPAGAAASPSV